MEWSFGDVFLTMVAFFFWFMFIWMFIGVFSDIFRRTDLSGWGKAGWLVLVCIFPFLGILVYMIARPTTETDKQMIGLVQSRGQAASYSTADEITKLTQLHDKGALSDDEFDRLKAKAIA
jgi:Short C-terminal domain/Phospholipase_D-nuclease N-terminal